MNCVFCGNEYPVSDSAPTCPACGKTPSPARLFLEAERGDAEALWLSAKALDNGENLACRADFLYRAARGGCWAAAIEYARMLFDGTLGQPDPAGAKYLLSPYVRKSPVAALLSLRAGLLTRAAEPKAPESPSRVSLRLGMARAAEEALDYPTAVALIRMSAEEGDPASEELLGRMYEEGRLLTGDRRLARIWYAAACRDGSDSACVRLGDALLDGRLTGKAEPEAAFACYNGAAERGYAAAQVRMGDCCFDGAGCELSVSDALAWYRKAAAKGEERAKEQVARITGILNESFRRAVALQEKGEDARAVALYTELAGMGYAEAANRLGYCTQRGIGTKKDRRAAARWFEAGACGGSVSAIYNLGVCYAEGIGVPFDFARATALLRNAAERNFPVGKTLGLLLERRRRHEVRKVYSLAAVVYRRGESAAAARFFLTAAEMGSPVAAYRLACQIRLGDGVEQDETKAKLWEEVARKAGFTDTKRISLGYLHERRRRELLNQ